MLQVQTPTMKPTLKIGLVAAVASLVFVAGYAKGQGAIQKDETAKIDDEIKSLNLKLSFPADRTEQFQAIDDLDGLVSKAKSSGIYRDRLRYSATRNYFIDSSGKDGQRAYQDAALRLMLLQTQQNERIIQLLEQQQKAK